jgi:hypothetical protein
MEKGCRMVYSNLVVFTRPTTLMQGGLIPMKDLGTFMGMIMTDFAPGDRPPDDMLPYFDTEILSGDYPQGGVSWLNRTIYIPKGPQWSARMYEEWFAPLTLLSWCGVIPTNDELPCVSDASSHLSLPRDPSPRDYLAFVQQRDGTLLNASRKEAYFKLLEEAWTWWIDKKKISLDQLRELVDLCTELRHPDRKLEILAKPQGAQKGRKKKFDDEGDSSSDEGKAVVHQRWAMRHRVADLKKMLVKRFFCAPCPLPKKVRLDSKAGRLFLRRAGNEKWTMYTFEQVITSQLLKKIMVIFGSVNALPLSSSPVVQKALPKPEGGGGQGGGGQGDDGEHSDSDSERSHSDNEKETSTDEPVRKVKAKKEVATSAKEKKASKTIVINDDEEVPEGGEEGESKGEASVGGDDVSTTNVALSSSSSHSSSNSRSGTLTASSSSAPSSLESVTFKVASSDDEGLDGDDTTDDDDLLASHDEATPVSTRPAKVKTSGKGRNYVDTLQRQLSDMAARLAISGRDEKLESAKARQARNEAAAAIRDRDRVIKERDLAKLEVVRQSKANTILKSHVTQQKKRANSLQAEVDRLRALHCTSMLAATTPTPAPSADVVTTQTLPPALLSSVPVASGVSLASTTAPPQPLPTPIPGQVTSQRVPIPRKNPVTLVTQRVESKRDSGVPADLQLRLPHRLPRRLCYRPGVPRLNTKA